MSVNCSINQYYYYRIVVVVVFNLKIQLRHMKTKDPIHDSRYDFFSVFNPYHAN